VKHFLLLILLSHAVFGVDLEKAAVKISSTWIGTPKKFFGSGLLFKKEKQVFCVTSDHVYFHTNSEATHLISLPGNPPLKARHLIADWGKGMGLLEINSPSSLLAALPDLPSLEELQTETLAVGDSLKVVGFPYLSEEVFSFEAGKVSSLSAGQQIFAEIPFLVRVEESYGEFGMSGGPVISSKGSFSGLLSHQDLTVPGEPQRNLLIIPAKTILEWLRDYFANPALAPVRVVQSPSDQASSFMSVQSGRLYISVGRYMGNDAYQAVFNIQKNAASPQPFLSPTGYYEKMVKGIEENEASSAYVVGFRQKIPFSYVVSTFSNPVQLVRLLANSELEPVLTLWRTKFPTGYEHLASLREPVRMAWDTVPYKCGGKHLKICSYLIQIREAVDDLAVARLKPSDLEMVLASDLWPDFRAQFGDYRTDTIRDLLERIRKSMLLVTF
jgi:hypothetical protein